MDIDTVILLVELVLDTTKTFGLRSLGQMNEGMMQIHPFLLN